MIWIPITVAAAAFQVARNALQRSLMAEAGPWGATLVRFLFGLPFTGAVWAVVALLTPAARPDFSTPFWLATAAGAMCQVLATAALLTAMRRAGFAIGTALQQSSLPLSAIIGLLVFNDQLTPTAWTGVAVTTAGLALLTWPRGAVGPQPLSGAAFALLSGLFFGVSLNAFRHSQLALEPAHRLYAAAASVTVAQALQSAVLGLWLAWRSPASLRALATGWRQSLSAGLCGAAASIGWFLAVAYAPAAPVRAVGVVEMPIAALTGRRLFAERLALWQYAAGALATVGVVLAALG